MTSADKITSIRLILAPVFFIVYFIPVWFPALGALWTVPVLWVLFIIAELTDLFDGLVARSMNEVSDFGKLFDPFADTLVRITYFLCFVVDGILPALLLMIVLYREFGILFLRTLMMKLGIAMGARSGGKLKAVAYMIAGILALIAASLRRVWHNAALYDLTKTAAIIIFAISVIISLGSFIDYYRVYKNAKNK
ncbi:CDP-diacylglycerol--glycerol-3-phosphate 3-phosphatidyltransferase [Gracilinema caldarium]|uniref:CDP-diacylglycerol--glycerol-3-phosphate 3-phosphatidyltransferase n=1 Tax=Gracilinema caldarium TaxID=215591 RepID=UPI0026EAEB12|nr:CDP-diacylglycerol--glycerol-3-phosphate 3-phosphatidyltransferase [Gracilinema caldarium]